MSNQYNDDLLDLAETYVLKKMFNNPSIPEESREDLIREEWHKMMEEEGYAKEIYLEILNDKVDDGSGEDDDSGEEEA